MGPRLNGFYGRAIHPGLNGLASVLCLESRTSKEMTHSIMLQGQSWESQSGGGESGSSRCAVTQCEELRRVRDVLGSGGVLLPDTFVM